MPEVVQPRGRRYHHLAVLMAVVATRRLSRLFHRLGEDRPLGRPMAAAGACQPRARYTPSHRQR